VSIATVGEALSMEHDLETWYQERAKWEEEIERSREMEKEAYERYEVHGSHNPSFP